MLFAWELKLTPQHTEAVRRWCGGGALSHMSLDDLRWTKEEFLKVIGEICDWTDIDSDWTVKAGIEHSTKEVQLWILNIQMRLF